MLGNDGVVGKTLGGPLELSYGVFVIALLVIDPAEAVN